MRLSVGNERARQRKRGSEGQPGQGRLGKSIALAKLSHSRLSSWLIFHKIKEVPELRNMCVSEIGLCSEQ